MVKPRHLRPKPILDEPSLRQFLVGHGVKPTHMERIWKHLLVSPECPLDEIPGIPDRIRAPLREEFTFLSSKLVKVEESAIDGTVKMLIRLQDGGEIEAVIIRHTGEPEDPERRQADRCGQRDTLCVSSQVGCRLGCTFCATGTMGLQGNLLPGEIQEQLVHAKSIRAISNVVFMGMGEPLENYDGVTTAIRGLIDPHRFGIAPSSVTVSTVGIIGNMRRFMDDVPKVRLAVSLHAPNQELRQQIVPIGKTYKLDSLMEVIDEYANRMVIDGKRKGMVMISYVLLAGVNDSEECANQLCDLLRGRPVIVNLIPYNSFEENVHGYETPSPEQVDDFLKVLAASDIRVFERRHHGRDIAAACGQLAKSGKQQAADIESLASKVCGSAVKESEDLPRPRAPAERSESPPAETGRTAWFGSAARAALAATSVLAVVAALRWHGRKR